MEHRDPPEIPLELCEQGCVRDCLYCTRVHPGLGDRCPFCHGAATGFRPARMMDGPTSRSEILQDFLSLSEPFELLWRAADEAGGKSAALNLRGRLLALLDRVTLHHFDASEALVEAIYRIEMENGLEPGRDSETPRAGP